MASTISSSSSPLEAEQEENDEVLRQAMTNASLSAASAAAPAGPATSSPSSLVIPLPTSLPTTLSRSYKLLGVLTDAYVQIFGDRIVVGISQRQQRIGTWCYCQATQSAIDPKAIDFDISTVLGDRSDAMVGVYARQITERILKQKLIGGGSTTMIVLLGMGLLQAKDPQMFSVVLDVLLQLIRDAILQMR